MATSQNGYFVFMENRTSGALPRLRKWVIPGTGRHAFLRDGSAGFLLVHMALRWHRQVEKISGGVWDEWGWAVRPVRGQTSGYSNHASGTALDINATQHPRGVRTRATMSVAEIDKVHALLRTYDGCIRWGGDYSGTPDAMHIEIDRAMAAVEAKARELWATDLGQEILDANPGAAGVIWDGKVPALKKPAPAKKKPATPPSESEVERLAIDYSYARPDPKAVKAAGMRGVIRYLSPNPAKNITRGEAKAIHDTGMWISLVWERTANRAGQGRAAGVADAKAAEKQADGLGVPDGVVIFYAVDYDAAPDEVRAYFAGVKATAKRPVGVYGSARIIDGITADAYWQTVAWSGGRVSSKANWLQKGPNSHTKAIKGSTAKDWDEVRLIGGKVPVWRAAKEPTPPKAPATEFVSGTFNSQQTDTAAQQRSDLSSLVRWGSLWGLQEISTDEQRAVLRGWAGWRMWPDNPELPAKKDPAGSVPLFWDDSVWELVSMRSIRVHGGQAKVTPSRWITVGRFNHRASVKRLTRINTHVVHHYESGGLPMKYPTAAAKLLYALQAGRARKHFAMLADVITEEAADGTPVVIGGDFNCNLFAEQRLPATERDPGFPLTVLSRVAMVTAPPEGTHGSRAIDQTWYVNCSDGLCVVQPLGNSDHRAVTTRFSI